MLFVTSGGGGFLSQQNTTAPEPPMTCVWAWCLLHAAVMHPKGAENKFWSCEWTSFSDGRHFCVMNPVLDRFWYVEKLDFWFSWAVIIRIKTEKGLKHFTSYVMNLEYTTVSFLELISEMKWTFQLYSDFWRCSCRSYTFALLKGTNVVLKKKNEEIQIHRRLIFTILMM